MLNPCFIGKHDTLELVERRLAGKARHGAWPIGKRSGGPNPGADVARGTSPVPAQMARGEPSPGADVGGGERNLWPGGSLRF